MDTFTKFTNDVLTPYWWISVVAVGLLINLASAYLKGPLDRWLDERVTSRKAESDRKRQEEEAWIDRLASEPQLLALEMHAELRYGISVAISCAGLVLALQPTSTSSGLAAAVLALTKLGFAVVSIVWMLRAVKAINLHHRNVELAKRRLLRR